ncbi:MAG: flippase-like domain-containing protein [Planctomycetes bacterium]|nr:flippase-like domain-containing protein [Planctomycetota bacterium]
MTDAEPLLSPKLKGRLALGLALGVVLYLGLALWGDGPGIARALRDFPLRWVAAATGLAFTNYVVRFARWERYRAVLGIRMARLTSFRIYLAGLALTVTPGKMGEAFRSLLIRAEDGTPISRSAPMVLAERFTDLLGFLILVAVGGIASQPEYVWVFWATLALCAVLLALVASRRVARWLLLAFERLPLFHRFAPNVERALEASRELLTPRELPFATLAATLGWGLECYGFFLVCEALAPGATTPLFAVYTYALSAIVGAVLILFPGGLGPTEATMGGLLARRLEQAGLAAETAKVQALSATFVIRLCTLWFAVAVGLAALGLHGWVRRRRG